MPGNPNIKFRIVGGQLGFPSDNNKLASQVVGDELRNLYLRVLETIERAKRANLANNIGIQGPNGQPPQPQRPPQHNAPNGLGNQQLVSTQINGTLLQDAIKKHPEIDFSSIDQEVIRTAPPQRTELYLRHYIETQNLAKASMQAKMHQLPTTIINRVPTPSKHHLQGLPHHTLPPDFDNPDLALVLKSHERCKERFRTVFATSRNVHHKFSWSDTDIILKLHRSFLIQ